MKRARRLSPQTAAVIGALAQEPTVWRYGYDLCQELGMKAGSMYPILMRLADRGLLETTWATDAEPGRPPRHLYRLTGTGLALAAQLSAAATAPNTAPPGLYLDGDAPGGTTIGTNLGDAISWLLLIVPSLMIPLGILSTALATVVVRGIGRAAVRRISSDEAAVGSGGIDKRNDS